MKKIAVKLGIDSEDLASCVSCGLCLPHCPTYRVTQEESASPRGRIALMRQAESTGLIDQTFVDFMDACIQCRGCETACPAGVPFGSMMETTREALTEQTSYQSWWRRWGYRVLGCPNILTIGSRALAVLQRLKLLPSKLALPKIPLMQAPLVASGEDVWLFTGCVMDVWMRDTHRATQRIIEAAGAGVRFPGKKAACCGALHVHAGLGEEARRLARRTMGAFPGDAPILVDSAGCGAQMKEYGHLLNTSDAHKFSQRVLDVHEWLVNHLDELPAAHANPPRIAIQDPCHLRHVQQAHDPVRVVLARYADPVILDDEGLCCGAGGAYSALHPDTAAAVRERKIESINRAQVYEVASANPGCLLHLQAGGVRVRHPLEIIDDLMRKDI
jgi:glycolate oxidase iron-sulfur subunit